MPFIPSKTNHKPSSTHSSLTKNHLDYDGKNQQISLKNFVIHFPRNLKYKRHLYTPQLPFNILRLIVVLRLHLHKTTHNPQRNLCSNFDMCKISTRPFGRKRIINKSPIYIIKSPQLRLTASFFTFILYNYLIIKIHNFLRQETFLFIISKSVFIQLLHTVEISGRFKQAHYVTTERLGHKRPEFQNIQTMRGFCFRIRLEKLAVLDSNEISEV